MFIRVLASVALICSVNALAISEVDYRKNIFEVVIPLLDTSLEISKFEAFDGLQINFAILKNDFKKGTIVISPGRNESVSALYETIFDFYQLGYSVAILDHRGQGHSDRTIRNSGIGHVRRFGDYVKDFTQFIEEQVSGKLPAPYFLLSDSLGAPISTFFLVKNPNFFSAAAFTSPLFKGKLQKLPYWVSRGFLFLFRSAGLGRRYAFSQHPFDFSNKFETNLFTHSRVRYEVDLERITADPTSVVGGPSFSWLYESLVATAKVRKMADKVTTPLLILQAGQDKFVNAKAQEKFCERAKACKIVTIPKSYHSIFWEEDSVREVALESIDRHFDGKH